ncbi:MAG: CBS domain-containing protein [Candidatus Bathyarchaeia archaeon]|jgi:CBS domain-containing protein
MAQAKRLTAADIMTQPVVTGGPYDALTRIAAQMQRHTIGSIVIVENRKIAGILTERDCVRIVEQVGGLLSKNQAKDHMTKPVLTVQSDTSVSDVIKLMSEKHIRHLVVLDKKGDVAGIISSRDLMKITKDVMAI